MKLAEALMERADLNRRIEQLRVRLENNVLVQEGEIPNEDPVALFGELDTDITRLETLMMQINHTNCVAKVNEKSLTQIIAEKDAAMLRINVYRRVLEEASSNTNRARGTEIRIRPVVSVAELQKKIDVLARKIRMLDNMLQQANWNTELLEK